MKTCVTRHNFLAKQVRDIVDALAPLPLTEREATCIALNQLKLTARLSSVAHLALQGIGPVETARYKVHEVLSERQAKNMAGIAFAATVCAASLLSFLSVWQRH